MSRLKRPAGKTKIVPYLSGWRFESDELGKEIEALLVGYDTFEAYQAAYPQGYLIEEKPSKEFIQEILAQFSITAAPAGPDGYRFFRLVPPPPVEEFHVDLKYALWSPSRSYWEDQNLAPVYDRVEAAWLGKAPPVRIYTSPRKEIRFGTVLVERHRFVGHFYTQWDDPRELMDTLELPCEYDGDEQAFRDSLPWPSWYHGAEDPGVEIEFCIDRHRKFERAMESVDNEECRLLALDEEAWQEIVEMYKAGGLSD